MQCYEKTNSTTLPIPIQIIPFNPTNLITSSAKKNLVKPSTEPNSKAPLPPQPRKLTSTEIMRRRNQDLCYTYDEKWYPGHKCQNKHVFILEGTLQGQKSLLLEEIHMQQGNGLQAFEQSTDFISSISLEAMCGVVANNTIRLQGSINGQMINIHIDSRSTHNFINTDLAKKLGLHIDFTKEFEVSIASGEKLYGQGVCSCIDVSCQGVKIQVDLLLLPVGGCQVVLGVQWMQELDDIIFNFKKASD